MTAAGLRLGTASDKVGRIAKREQENAKAQAEEAVPITSFFAFTPQQEQQQQSSSSSSSTRVVRRC